MKKRVISIMLLSFILITLAGCKKETPVSTTKETPVSTTEEKKGIQLVSISEVQDSIDKEDLYIFVLGNGDCSACEMYEESLKELEDTEGVRLDYIDISVEDRDEVQDLLFNVLKQDPQQGISTPTTFFIRNGEVVDTLVGAVGAEVIMEEYGDLIKEFAQ